jgi:hypothetical protein
LSDVVQRPIRLHVIPQLQPLFVRVEAMHIGGGELRHLGFHARLR